MISPHVLIALIINPDHPLVNSQDALHEHLLDFSSRLSTRISQVRKIVLIKKNQANKLSTVV